VLEGVSDEEAVRRVYLMALCREPTQTEKVKVLGIMREAAKDGQSSRAEALEDLFWGVLTSREFLFNH
jgi:hypothetical protein